MAETRTRETPPPRQWPNGSAIFATGFTQLGHNKSVKPEETEGFLGRICRLQGRRYKVWEYLKGQYVNVGLAYSFSDALNMLGAGKNASPTKQEREKPERSAEVRIESEVLPLPMGVKPGRLRRKR